MRAVLRLVTYTFSVTFCKFTGDTKEGKDSVCVIEKAEGAEARWYRCIDTPFPSTAPKSVGISKS